MKYGWKPYRLWRVTYSVNGERRVWCETSSKSEARERYATAQENLVDAKLERLWERHEEEWRPYEQQRLG